MGESHEEMLRHYEPVGLLPRIVAGFQALGKDLDSVTHEDLAPADEPGAQGLLQLDRALEPVRQRLACGDELGAQGRELLGAGWLRHRRMFLSGRRRRD